MVIRFGRYIFQAFTKQHLSLDDSNATLTKQSDTDSTIPKAPVKGMACHLWLKAGTCRFGDRCRFLHNDSQVCALN